MVKELIPEPGADLVDRSQRRPARLTDVAARAGVSMKTVSRVLNGEPYVSAQTSEVVRKAARELGYVGDALARGLRLKQSGSLGLLIPDIRNGYYALLIRAFEELLRPRGINVVLGDSDESIEVEETYLRIFRQQRVDGLIVASVGAPGLQEAARQIPTVVVDIAAPFVREIADEVVANDRQAAAALVAHLVDTHKTSRVCLIGGRPASSTRNRMAGYEHVLKQSGLKPLISAGHLTPDEASKGAYELFSRVKPPFGVLTTNNRMFWGAMAAIARLGLRIPTDVKLATFDSIGEATVTGLVPTQAVIPVETLAQRALDMLSARQNNPSIRGRRAKVTCAIEFGTTCGCIPLESTPLALEINNSPTQRRAVPPGPREPAGT